MAWGGPEKEEVDKEVNKIVDEGKEEEALEENLKYVRKLLSDMYEREKMDMSGNTRNLLNSIKMEMKTFVDMANNDKGARAKTKDEKKETSEEDEVNTSEETSESSFNSAAESFDEQSENESEKPRRKLKHKSKDIVKMMSRLDMRRTPELRNYEEEKGESLKSYLQEFEDYCNNNIRGKRRLWKGELEKHLTGRTLESFRALHTPLDNYDDIRRKMLNWYNDEKKMMQTRARKKLDKMKPNKGEPMYIYSNRLETQFKLAYPKKSIEKSQAAIYKLRKTVPKSLGESIGAKIMADKLKERRTEWRKIQKMARI